MKNLTEVSLKNKIIVWYFIIMSVVMGIFSYISLGRMEDPTFTIPQMVITAAWPGATAQQMEEQVTDKLESKVRDIPGIDYVKSSTRAGTSIIYVNLRQDVDRSTIRDTWRDVRNFGADIQKDLPAGVYGPYYNDRFDDVYGSIYAITGDGYSYEELRQQAERLRRMILKLDNVQKVELQGVQTEKVYVEIENAKLAELGISPTALSQALASQNDMTSAGMVETSTDNVYLRFSGVFDDIEAMKNVPVNAGGQIFALGDIATIERRFSDPANEQMFFNGEPAVGVAVSMEPGGNIITLGENLEELISKVQAEMPVGLEIHEVSDQPQVVEESISEFVSTLREAVIIVLAVSFLTLGVRTGMVVAFCIPLVLATVFCGMYIFGIDLHKVSLGALIIALGLLVDDAIIAVEMMSVQLERGFDRFQAACYAFKATAKPMLTGTLITCAGFIPVAFSKGMAAEFCSALFPVIGMALVLSWIVSVMVAPLFGYYLIKVKPHNAENGDNPYQGKFYVIFKDILCWCLVHRRMVLTATAVMFGLSIAMLGHIKQEFFPPSIRPEIIVEMRLPEGSSLKASADNAARFSDFLDEHMENIENYSYYVGKGAPRFVLTLDPVLPANNYAQFVVVAKDTKIRSELEAMIRSELAENFTEVRANLKNIQTGPPAPYPVMLRVSGYDHDKVRSYANRVAERVAADSNNIDINMDWNEKSKVVHLEFDQSKLRAMGVSPKQIAQTLHTELVGARTTQFYSGDRTIDIEFRMKDIERNDLDKLKNLPIYLGAKGYVPLEQLAEITLEAEDGLIWRRDMLPTVTVQANIKEGTANDATKRALESVEDIRAEMSLGYDIQAGGALEDSGRSSKFLLVPIPLMIFVIMTLLMFQLQNGKHMILTLLTAPLGIIGVSFGMLIFGKAMGFVALIGVLALSGMIIRNSVILIDQIQKHIADGETPWNAVVDSAVLRFRPIMLTAAAAILGMVPLMTSTFWGPMAVAIASGLLVATVLTLLVLPAMYAECYKVEKE